MFFGIQYSQNNTVKQKNMFITIISALIDHFILMPDLPLP